MGLLEHAFVFILGLCLGSFANVCIYRIPLGQSILKPGSHCPHCGKSLRWRHNVPILSFLFLKARCAFCRSPVSWLYPLGEFGFAVMFWLTIALRHTPWAMAPAGGCLVFFLWIICFIDWKHRIIPDPLSLGLLASGILFCPWNPFLGESLSGRVLQSLAGGAFGFFLLYFLAWAGEKIFRREAMGGGDIKFMAALGVFLGWRGVWGTLFIASLAGTACALGLMAFKRAGRGSYLPFGPFLALAAWLVWTYAERLPLASLFTPWMLN